MKLLFVYNANSGKINSLLDIGYKLLSPNTYKCDLCALTHDIFKENDLWKAFRKNSDLEMVFYHSDEFKTKYPKHIFELPIVLSEIDGTLKEFISSEELKYIKDTQSLIHHLNQLEYLI